MAGQWFQARYEGDCDQCGAPFEEGDMIRSDGEGGWQGECCAGDEDE